MTLRLRWLVRICACAAGMATWNVGGAAAQQWTLLDAVGEALDRHPALAEASARVDVATARADMARAAYLPSLAASASTVRFAEPMVVAPLHGFDPLMPPSFDNTLVRSQLALSFTVFDGGVRRAGMDAAGAGGEVARSGVAATRAAVIEATAQAYTGAQTAAVVLVASDRRLQALNSELERVERLLAVGAAAEVERLRARAALAQAEADHASARANLTAALSILGRLTGRGSQPPIAATPPVLGPSATGGAPTDPPELALAEAQASAASARRRAARASFLPRIALATSADQYGATGRAFSAEWQAGVQVSLPIFLGGARLAELRQRGAEVAEADAAVERVRLDIATSRDRTQSAITEAQGRVAALTSAEAQLTEVARVEALALAEGSGVQRDLLAAEASLFVVRADLARARAADFTARIALARVEGRLTLKWLTAGLEDQR